MSNASDFSNQTLKWLAYAQSDLRAAKALLKTNKDLTNQVCYHSQQAAEKAIKAGLIFLRIDFPFVHDLDELRDRLPKEWKCVQDYPDLDTLTGWAVNGRYPDSAEDPSEAEASRSIQQASGILISIKQDLEERGLSLEE
ncbi:MAG: HEPN domain-containing protein [Leptolyngbya foveolarum]|uniref:HEPN domain-containing protein n=1 Tax=Leptolyngbya foveolarum TaxID=47253 RepID=A0A2W4U4R1_9CYAN|nr:MAG: HEPN domain-containing protein [Leptolyngbya foveolarum]